MEYSEVCGKMINEKTWSRKSRVGPPPCARPFSCRNWRAVRICQPRQRMSFSWSPCPRPVHNQIKMAAAWRNYSALGCIMTVPGSWTPSCIKKSPATSRSKHIEEIHGPIPLYPSEGPLLFLQIYRLVLYITPVVSTVHGFQTSVKAHHGICYRVKYKEDGVRALCFSQYMYYFSMPRNVICSAQEESYQRR